MAAQLEFLTRPRCGICDDALAILEPMAKLVGVGVVVRSAPEESDVALRVPVIRLADGRELHTGPLGRGRAAVCIIRARFTRNRAR